MSLARGTKLGHYEIGEPLGAGGMGEVYRARDTRLDRTVAIKVLPQHLSENGECRERFEQEARAVSKLNHPNICTLHDIGRENGVDFMVMECIEGDSLADRLQKGPLPVDDARRCATAIGDALDKAHRQGIVHRDLKPGNVMLTKMGPKLLDFGLAKLQTKSQDPDLSAVTEQKPLTEEGAILGTFQYMAPEQLEGGEIDARTDIFAFGALLYEILTGQKAFTGKSQASLISAIMTSEPPHIGALRPTSPKSLDRIVKRCLAKDPDDRWQSARDVVLELESIEEDRDDEEAPMPASRTKERLAWAALALGAAVLAFSWASSTVSPSNDVTRTVIPLHPGHQLLGETFALGASSSVDISRDGRVLAYTARGEDHSYLYLRRLDNFEATQIAGTEGVYAPFFSPDGQWVGFRAAGEIRKAAVEGTTTIKIADMPVGGFQGASWADDGTIVVGGRALTRVSDAGGGLPTTVAEMEAIAKRPQVLPGGDNVLVTLRGDPERVAVVSMESGEVRTLLEGYGGARYVASGHLVVSDVATNTLLAVGFDVDTLEVRGTPVSVVDGVYMSPRSGIPQFAVSDTGVLVYVPAASVGTILVWVDRQGNVIEPLNGLRGGAYSHPRLAPDGRRVAVDMFIQASRDVWVYDLERGTRARLTNDGVNGTPVWTPDGSRVSFYSGDHLYSRTADASTERELLLDESRGGRYPMSWSPDGSTLAFAEDQPAGDRDIILLPLGGEPRAFLSTSFNERAPMFSPNGRFIAYVSDQSGRYEVYVRTYPGGDEMWLVSTDGGTAPVWSRDGDELFYRNGHKMMAVSVDTSDTFRFERPSLLFEGQFFLDTAAHPAYDVSQDGERFLMIQESPAERDRINVVHNWFEELERLVPTQ